MLLSMEYGHLKPHEADAFVLDHVIAYKQSLKFNSQNVLMKVNLENFLPGKLPTIWYFPSKTHYTLDHKTAMIPHIFLQLPLIIIIEKQ